MADRKAELEKKRKKLEQLRIAREQKKKETADKDVVAKPEAADPRAKERHDLDSLMHDLLGPSSSKSAGSSRPPEPSGSGGGAVQERVTTPPSAPPPRAQRKAVSLVVDSLASINIKPRSVEVYAKHTQTEVSVDRQRSESEEEVEAEPIRPDRRHESESEAVAGEGDADRKPHPLLEMSSEQKERIVVSDDFSLFMDRAGRLMERALCEPSDILFDILGENEIGGDSLASFTVVKKTQLLDERWSQNRDITAMDWSSQHPELLLVSHYKNPNVPHDPDGVVLVWDLMFQKDTPDYVFNCQSAVTSVVFSKFHPSYVVGGTYSGQIVLWDMRSGRRTPVQRSPLSSTAHTHPVYCLDVVGTQNAHNLISVSNQGKLCSWNLDMLSQPQESLELQNRQTRPAAVTCLSFPLNDVNKFLVGSEECTVYQAQRHGSKPGITMQYDGHFGPVSAISSHRAFGSQVDLSHLFLTSSFDWTVKLWSNKLLSEQQITQKTGKPLASFENNTEYVYDVKWSPVHPALFASADGAGRMDIWNINADSEVPVLSESLDAPLNKLQWSPNGRHLACGDMEGRVHIFEAGEGLTSPSSEEWSLLHQTILDMQASQEQQTS